MFYLKGEKLILLNHLTQEHKYNNKKKKNIHPDSSAIFPMYFLYMTIAYFADIQCFIKFISKIN